jgi:hypothetical protein
VDFELLATSVVADFSEKFRDDLAITSVHHTVGKLTKALHEVVQCLSGTLR